MIVMMTVIMILKMMIGLTMILNDDETRTEKEQRKHFQPQGSQTPPIITSSDPTELRIQCNAVQ